MNRLQEIRSRIRGRSEGSRYNRQGLEIIAAYAEEQGISIPVEIPYTSAILMLPKLRLATEINDPDLLRKYLDRATKPPSLLRKLL